MLLTPTDNTWICATCHHHLDDTASPNSTLCLPARENTSDRFGVARLACGPARSHLPHKLLGGDAREDVAGKHFGGSQHVEEERPVPIRGGKSATNSGGSTWDGFL